MLFVPFLHIYQPPTQYIRTLKKVAAESYAPLIETFERNPKAKATINICASLTEQLVNHGYFDLVRRLGRLAERGQIELTGSAAYHPLLTRLPRSEVERQVRLNEEINCRHLGVFKPRGFFPPEMAFSREVGDAVSRLGYDWVLIEEITFPKRGKVRRDVVYRLSGSKLDIFFRNRDASLAIAFGRVRTASELEKTLSRSDEYFLAAMDGETFGHHRPGMEKLLFELYKTPRIKTVLISDLPNLFKEREVVETRPATWALMQKDLEMNVPFARWEDPGNTIHELQWKLTDLAIKTVRAAADPGLARKMLDQALHSDQYWWACARPWWSLEMIERGAHELKEAIFAVPDVPDYVRQQAQDLYYQIVTTGFEWQRAGRVDELARKEDEAMRMIADRGIAGLPKNEIRQMIVTIRRELEQVVKNQEYERAAQLRDRIKELEGYVEGGNAL